MMLVLIMMAVATIMAYALLGNAAVQDEASANQASASQADALAESGIELAMYYLQHPANAPSLVAAAGNNPPYWSGASNISFSGMPGTVTVTVSPSGTTGTVWSVNAVGSSSLNGQSVSKTLSATAQVNGTYQTNMAMASNVTVNVPATGKITGGIETPLDVVVALGGQLTGLVSALVVSGGSGTTTSPPISNPVPPVTSLRSYLTYQYSGSTGNATVINQSANNNPTAGNPAGIYKFTTGSVTLKGPITIHGTVYVPNGNVTYQSTVNITPTAGFPAIVCSGVVQPSALGASLTANGAVYAAGGIGTADIFSSLTINGTLLTVTGSINALFLGTLKVTYNSAEAAVPDLTSVGAYLTPVSVKLTAWNP